MSIISVFSASPFPPLLNTATPKSHRRLTFKTTDDVGSFTLPKRSYFPFLASSSDNAAVIEERKVVEKAEVWGSNGPAFTVPKFRDARWVAGTWDLEQFKRGKVTDWDAVIDAEVRRRKWLKEHPESTSNDDPVVFRSSTIPWWPWVKRFHLPEAELLNGRAAMIGFFMAYLVDSLTGVSLVDQMGNFFCKTLMLVAVVGVLLIRKNEDIQTMKNLFNEITLYDRQWQATWKEVDNDSTAVVNNNSKSKNNNKEKKSKNNSGDN